MPSVIRALKIILLFVLAWLAAAVIVAAVGTFLQTQNVVARLNGVGADIALSERLSMTGYDLTHLGTLYLPFIAAGALVAYLAGLLVYRLAGFGRPVVFAVAGAVAMLVMLLLMKQAFFGIHIIAGARSGFGIALQMLGGAVGGLVFEQIFRPSVRIKPVRVV